MNPDTLYYVRRQGRVEGPWSLDKLRSEVRLRKLARYHEVSTDSRSWQPASTLAELFARTEVRKVLGGNQTAAAPADEPKQEAAAEPAIWYCDSNGKQAGPMTQTQLGELVSAGGLRLDDLVWRDGFPDWLPFEDVPELQVLLETGNSRTSQAGDTEATRVVTMQSSQPKVSALTWTSSISGCVLFFLSCLPGVGFLGILPLATGGYSAYKIRSTGGKGMGFAIAGIVLGLLAIGITILALAAGGILFFQNRDLS